MLWIDGTKEDCWPQNIELLPEYGDFTFPMSDSEEDDAISWETESIESIAGDVTDSTSLQNIASRLDFIRNRIVYLKEAFRQHTFEENFNVRTQQQKSLIFFSTHFYLVSPGFIDNL